jgi:AcrR family transcriptional regulator
MATATRNRGRRLDRRTRTARAQGRDGRAALLQAAMEVFAQRGYRDASLDEIAARAGYSKGAIYFYFAGKDDLFFALLEERIDRPMRQAIKLLESASPEDDMAAEANRHFLALVSGQRELLLLDHEYRSQAIRDSKLRARYLKREAKLHEAPGRATSRRAPTARHRSAQPRLRAGSGEADRTRRRPRRAARRHVRPHLRGACRSGTLIAFLGSPWRLGRRRPKCALKQRQQLVAFVARKPAQHFPFDLPGDVPGPLQDLPALRGDRDFTGASVGGVGPAFGEALGFELVDEHDHRAAVDAHLRADLLLYRARASPERVEQREQGGCQTDRLESFGRAGMRRAPQAEEELAGKVGDAAVG